MAIRRNAVQISAILRLRALPLPPGGQALEVTWLGGGPSDGRGMVRESGLRSRNPELRADSPQDATPRPVNSLPVVVAGCVQAHLNGFWRNAHCRSFVGLLSVWS